MDELRHAWAVLQLRPGSDIDKVRASYRRLAKRWHPDRFANDPRSQAEAAIQMKVVNGAYQRLLEAAAQQPNPTESDHTTRPTGRRLSREEIDRLVAAIGTESWVESGLSHLPYWGAADWFTFRRSDNQWAVTPSVAVGLVFLAGYLVIGIFEWSGKPLPSSAGTYIGLGMVAAAWVVAYVVARRRQS